jgi:hypothetical protein
MFMQRGKIPYFVPPPLAPGETPSSVAKSPNQRVIIGPDGKVSCSYWTTTHDSGY